MGVGSKTGIGSRVGDGSSVLGGTGIGRGAEVDEVSRVAADVTIGVGAGSEMSIGVTVGGTSEVSTGSFDTSDLLEPNFFDFREDCDDRLKGELMLLYKS